MPTDEDGGKTKMLKRGGVMTDKQKRFCEEYLIDFNATQAAIRAGYSEKTANRIASENLSKPDIQKYIAELQAESQERNQIKRDDIVNELKRIGFADIDIDFIRVKDKIKALELLTKILGLDKTDNEDIMKKLDDVLKTIKGD